MDYPSALVEWPRYCRLVSSAYPPIDVFEDIAPPEDWWLLSSGIGKSNPRIADTVGKLDMIPPHRRIRGPGASYVMAPFTHCSPHHAGRFHDGHFGAFYAAREFETAVAETVFHTQRFLRATQEAPGWIATKCELVGRIAAKLVDLRTPGAQPWLDPDPQNYPASQRFAQEIRAAGAEGIVYPSVRHHGGECFAAFWPDVMQIPEPGRYLDYFYNGSRIEYIREREREGTTQVYAVRGS